jgi:hypothetical protein
MIGGISLSDLENAFVWDMSRERERKGERAKVTVGEGGEKEGK